eukprot:2795700-Prymnesium_polylepis.1
MACCRAEDVPELIGAVLRARQMACVPHPVRTWTWWTWCTACTLVAAHLHTRGTNTDKAQSRPGMLILITGRHCFLLQLTR